MIGVALLVAIGLGTWISGEEQPTEPSAPPILVGEPGVDADLDERLQYLEQALAEEREARIALEDTLAMLFEELERLEGTDELTAQNPGCSRKRAPGTRRRTSGTEE